MPIREALLLFAMALTGRPAIAGEVPAGQIQPAVNCQADPAQTYALYLPPGYTAAREWPAIYCFDPGARGRVPVDRFRTAAERYGYIVAGSNNSRNGPLQPSLAAADAVWVDTNTRFRIDPRRVYLAGFSGGARLALSLALSSPVPVDGVIACGAGFPGPIPAKLNFAFFGAAGIDDFNYAELRRLARELEPTGAAYRIVFFDGGHEWAPASVLADAVQWLGSLGAPSQDGYRERIEAARRLQSAGRLEEAWFGLRSVARDYRGLQPVDEIEAEARRLAASEAFRRDVRDQDRQERRELELGGELISLGDKDRKWLRAAVERLERTAAAPEDSLERRTARRTLRGVNVRTIEESRRLIEQKDWRGAAAMLEVSTAIRPQPFELLNLARAWLRAGDGKRARRAFGAAFELGLGHLWAGLKPGAG